MTDRDSQSTHFTEVADSAFVELAFVLQNIGLAYGGARSDGKADGQGNRLGSAGHGIERLIAPALDSVGVSAVRKNQHRIVNQHGTAGNIFERLGHRGGRLSLRLPVA